MTKKENRDYTMIRKMRQKHKGIEIFMLMGVHLHQLHINAVPTTQIDLVLSVITITIVHGH